jgi:hypothetical protein
VTIMDELSYTSNFFDTNFVWRGTAKWPRGLRATAGPPPGGRCVTSALPDLRGRWGHARRPERPAARRHDARLQPVYAMGNERQGHRSLYGSAWTVSGATFS